MEIKYGQEDSVFNSEMTMLITHIWVKKKEGRGDMPGLNNGQEDSPFDSEMRMVKTHIWVKKKEGRRDIATCQNDSNHSGIWQSEETGKRRL